MSEENQYDVAFSFLQRDEQLALETADRIRDRGLNDTSQSVNAVSFQVSPDPSIGIPNRMLPI
jgi:hypothetical protein